MTSLLVESYPALDVYATFHSIMSCMAGSRVLFYAPIDITVKNQPAVFSSRTPARHSFPVVSSAPDGSAQVYVSYASGSSPATSGHLVLRAEVPSFALSFAQRQCRRGVRRWRGPENAEVGVMTRPITGRGDSSFPTMVRIPRTTMGRNTARIRQTCVFLQADTLFDSPSGLSRDIAPSLELESPAR